MSYKTIPNLPNREQAPSIDLARFDTELNPPQREAVLHTEGPLLIVAGAGSGKTRVLAYRAAYLVQSGLAKPYQILCLTFTNKAAGELRGRAAQMVGRDGDMLVAGTFHSIFARIMRQEGLNIGIDPRFTIIDVDDRKRLIKEILRDLGIGSDSAKPAEIAWMIERAKNTLMSPEEFAKLATLPIQKTAVQVYERYESRLRRMSGLDFDDLLSRPIEAFQKYPEFLERLQNRFRYVMVDEFQDTNPAQYTLVKSIALGKRNLGVVGDDDQAIYGFRGATVANILEFEHDWPDAKVIRLEQNYRSHRYILDLAWAVIKHNPNRHPKKLWTSRQDGRPTMLIRARTDEEEALQFTSCILEERRANGRSLNDCAILYRTNAQSLPFERALRTAGLPYQVVGGLRFYERKEIKDLLAYLRILINPADDISLMRIINYPPRGIGESVISEIQQHARREIRPMLETVRSYASWGNLQPRAAKAINEFLKLMDGFRESTSQAFPELVKQIIITTRLRERLEEEEKDDPTKAESKLANLDSLIADVARFAELSPDKGIEGFLEEVALVTELDKYDESQEKVSLMTIHTAKGLEFPMVMIGGLEEGMLPMTSPDGSQEDIEEERRLFFVGATRAKDFLALGYAEERVRWGDRRYAEPSRFLKEIPAELLMGSWKRSAPITTAPVRPFARPTTGRSTTPTEKPSVPGASLDPDDLRYGALVRHPTFGLGLIIDFRRQGQDSRIDVDFDEVGRKTLILKYARLELVK